MSRTTIRTDETEAAARIVLDPTRLRRAGERRAAAFASAAGELDAVVAGIEAAGGRNAPGVNLSAIAEAMQIARPTLYRILDRKGIR